MSQRLAIVKVSYEALADLLRLDGSQRIRIDGLPADARILETLNEPFFNPNLLALKVQSEKFALIEPGQAIPVISLDVTVK